MADPKIKYDIEASVGGEADVQTLLQVTCRDEWNRARLLPALWYLVGTFQFGADLNAPLTMTSRLWSKG